MIVWFPGFDFICSYENDYEVVPLDKSKQANIKDGEKHEVSFSDLSVRRQVLQ